LEIFKEIVRKVGFRVKDEHSFKFPNSELASVSINLLKEN